MIIIENSLEKRPLKSLLMRGLTVPIVMERWLMEAVLFVRFQVLEMLSWHRMPPIREQFYKEIDFMHRKWPDVQKYLVYFQNFTNTHEKVEVIRERYEQAINEPGVVGINIGTRPDCLPDETIEYLAELSERMHVTVELGLQTTYEATSDLINRAHSYKLYVETVKRLRKYPKIEIVSHLINGLPGETHEMMVENVRRCITDNDIQGIKLHLLHLMTNTRMQRDYHEGRLH